MSKRAYKVVLSGVACPLAVGEVVTEDQAAYSLMTGEVKWIDVVRENGETVRVERGDTGAILERVEKEAT